MTSKIGLAMLFLSVFASAQRIWLLEQPDQIVEYDPQSFARKTSHEIPKDVLQYPQDLQINKAGQMLFLPSTVREPDGLVHASNSQIVWLWNGKVAMPIPRAVIRKTTPQAANSLVESSAPRCALSSDGTHLFWFDNSSRSIEKNDGSLSLSSETTFRAWVTDLVGTNPQQLTNYPFGICKCDTGSCEETCPEANSWWPDSGVSNFFVMTKWVPGQEGSDYQESILYRNTSSGSWSATKLSAPVEEVLDSYNEKEAVAIIEAKLDSGCCGWVNESDDQVLLNETNGRRIVLFDEWKLYQNRDYDISFFASMAKFSSSHKLVGMTIEATHKSGDELRLADQGKDNPAELAKIKKVLPDMPAVQIVEVVDPVKQLVAIPHARFVGWLSETEILLIEDNLLVAFDIATHSRRRSQIKVAKPDYVFVR